MSRSSFIRPTILIVLLAISAGIPLFAQAGLVISQIYGGGGNNAASFSADFVELYNPTSSPISTTGLSIQYASATGNFTQSLPLTSGLTVQPGHYFLVQTTTPAAPFVGAGLPTPDTSGTAPNLSPTNGKVALVNGTAALSGDTTCALVLADPAVLDLVGFGTANCFKGTAAAPGPSATNTNTQAILRTLSTNNNSADFTVISPPTPRNSSSGTVSGLLSATGVASPASVIVGQTTLLTVTVVPAVSPASSGIAVVGDLRLIGGSQTQAFSSVGNNVYSYTAGVTTAGSGLFSLPITITDAQSDSASASIALTVSQPAPNVEIHDIQGVKSTTSLTLSPYAGQRVSTTGVVTAVLSNGFFIQSRNPDANPLTPEGIDVFTSSAPPAAAAVGNVVTVLGTVATFPAVSASHTPATELTSPTVTLVSTGAALPAPVTLTASMLTAGGGLYQLTPYEGMRVAVPSLTTISGTNGSVTPANEATESGTSTGYFYAVITGTARPFREPGIDLRDVVVPGTPTGVAVFDDNPERILVDSTVAGGTPIEISTGAVLTNVTGVLDFTFSSDSFYDPSRLILDATYSRANVTPGLTVKALPLPAANEFTVASYNIERFYNTASADDLYFVPAGVRGFNGNSNTGILSTGQTFQSAAVDVTQAAYTRRLQKLSLAVWSVLNLPDVLTLEEVENQSVANDIAAQINADAGIANLYKAYSTDNTSFFTQDGTGISVGFLVKNTVNALSVTQFGQNETFTPTTSGNPITLNDRPWLVLKAGVKRANAKDYPITVVANHMKALTGENSATSSSTRQKKEFQAEDIARYIQGLQLSGEHVISGGDFNAFEFSDGYADTLATYTNVNVLAPTQVLQPGVAGLVTPPLADLALTLPASQRWSYVEDGSAQILDHLVVTADLAAAGAHMAYAHINSDFPVTAYNDATTAARTSDHDVAVGYFAIPAPVLSGALSPTATTTFASTTIGASSAGQQFTFTNTGEAPVTITSVTGSGDYAASATCNTAEVAVGGTCSVNVVFTPKAAGTRTGSVTFTTNITTGATFTGALTGTGLVPDFSIGSSSGSSSVTVSVNAGQSVSVPLTFTSINSYAGSITMTCTAPSTAPKGVACLVPGPFSLTGTSTTQTVTFTTTGRIYNAGFGGSGRKGWRMATLAGLGGLLLLFTARRSPVWRTGVLLLALSVMFSASGCEHVPTLDPNATSAGSYAYTITASSGALSHSETIALIVQ